MAEDWISDSSASSLSQNSDDDTDSTDEEDGFFGDDEEIRIVKNFYSDGNSVTCVLCYEHEKRLVTGMSKGIIRIWDSEKAVCIKKLGHHSRLYRYIHLIKWEVENDNQDLFLSAGSDGRINIFSLKEMKYLRMIFYDEWSSFVSMKRYSDDLVFVYDNCHVTGPRVLMLRVGETGEKNSIVCDMKMSKAGLDKKPNIFTSKSFPNCFYLNVGFEKAVYPSVALVKYNPDPDSPNFEIEREFFDCGKNGYPERICVYYEDRNWREVLVVATDIGSIYFIDTSDNTLDEENQFFSEVQYKEPNDSEEEYDMKCSHYFKFRNHHMMAMGSNNSDFFLIDLSNHNTVLRRKMSDNKEEIDCLELYSTRDDLRMLCCQVWDDTSMKLLSIDLKEFGVFEDDNLERISFLRDSIEGCCEEEEGEQNNLFDVLVISVGYKFRIIKAFRLFLFI